MSTKTDNQERRDFEANEKARFGYGKDTLVRYPTDEHEYYMPLTQARWEGWQAGRATLLAERDALREALEIARDFVAEALVHERVTYRGYELASDIDNIEYCLGQIDAALAQEQS